GDITEEATVTGYFLKMYGYAAQDTTRKAPLILSQTVQWRPQRAPTNWIPSPQMYLALSAGAILICLLAVLSQRRVSAKRPWAKYENFVPPLEGASSLNETPSQNGSRVEPHH